MKRILISTMLLGAVATSSLLADAITIYTGSETGNYHKVIGKSLKDSLEKRGHTVTLKTSKGSVENIQNVAGQKNVIGLAQADVARGLIESDEKYSDIGMNGNLGYECLFTTVRADGADNWADITGKIAAGATGSGTLYTVQQLVKMNPLPKATLEEKQGERYIGKVENKSYGAYTFMSIPDPKNSKILEVMDNKEVDFLPMHDLELGALGEGDNPVYTKMSVPTEKSFLGKTKSTLDTICTHATIVVDENTTSEKVLDDLYFVSKEIQTQSQTAYGFASTWLKKAGDKYKELTK